MWLMCVFVGYKNGNSKSGCLLFFLFSTLFLFQDNYKRVVLLFIFFSMKNNYSPDLLHANKEDVYYTLTMFPYPSGYGLHVWHASVFTINDVNARYHRMKGKVVLNPFGFDSFGLPTENYAMQQGKAAWQVTEGNVKFFLSQIEALDMSFDMERILITSDPEYYKWTQWIFAELYRAGLVYRAEKFVNRCPSCQTVLANDQVVDGLCERCKSEIIQKKHPQWFIKITDYADRLIADLDTIDRPEETKLAQKNWIGRSEWAEIDFIVQTPSPLSPLPTASLGEGITKITVFTTRPDTLFGVTALVLAPENMMLDEYLSDENKAIVWAYRKESMAKTAVQRQQDTKEKSGVFSGIFAIHPLTGEQVPVWFADYVLMDYGTGAVMFVPAHDERDWEFAEKHGLNVKQVIQWAEDIAWCYTWTWILINSWQFTWLDNISAKKAITDHLESIWAGKAKITYKLRDWSVSRQRYWGSPIPVYYDENHIPHLVPDSELPVVLPRDIENYKPKGKSPLEDHSSFPIYHKKPSVLLIHGRGNSSIDGWSLMGIQKNLVSQWYEVIFPDLSFEQDQNYEKAMKDIAKYDVDMVIGHSSGWYLAMQYANTKMLCKEIVLIAPTLDTKNMKLLQEKAVNTFASDRVFAFHREDIDFWNLQDRNISLIFGENDPYVDSNFVEQYKSLLPKAYIQVLWSKWHMGTGEENVEEVNTFIQQILRQLKNTSYRRECDTLDTFMCSSFYFLRFPDVHNPNELIRKELGEKMFPVDLYTGGKEHTVGHLLYSRFIHKFLYDQGYVNCPEPFAKLVHQGMIMGSDGRKMGKRYGNVIDPLDVVATYGSDAVRTYLMFMGPVEQEKIRNDNALKGIKKFIDRIERACLVPKTLQVPDDYQKIQKSLESLLHKTVKAMSEDMEKMKYNTAVSKLMILLNAIEEAGSLVSKDTLEVYLHLLAPFAPKISQDIWTKFGHEDDITLRPWPQFDAEKAMDDEIVVPVQINGKRKLELYVSADADEWAVMDAFRQTEEYGRYIGDQTIKKIIYVKGKILNIVI